MEKNNTVKISFSIDGVIYSFIHEVEKKARNSGGNANVIIVQDKYAVKILNSFDDEEKYKRFIIEIETAEKVTKRAKDAVIPILHKNIPSFEDQKEGKDICYYVMPKCETVKSISYDIKYDEYLDILIDASDSLLKIHNCGYAHRDVKKSNILFYQGHWLMSDYGCSFSKVIPRITDKGEKVGPKGCPEELKNIEPKQNAGNALRLFQSSDSFLFAKMAWHLIVDGEIFEGSFVRGDNNYKKYLGEAIKRFENKLFLPIIYIMEKTIIYEASRYKERMSLKEIREKLIQLKYLSNINVNSEEYAQQLLEQHLLVYMSNADYEYMAYKNINDFKAFFAGLPNGTKMKIDKSYVPSGELLYDSNKSNILDESNCIFKIFNGINPIVFSLSEIKVFRENKNSELITKDCNIGDYNFKPIERPIFIEKSIAISISIKDDNNTK